MAVEFIIQASNPRMLRFCDSDDATLTDAIQTVFPMDTENAVLAWNNIYVPLSYKYDLSVMTDDIVQLCEEMLASPHGVRLVHWPSNTFTASWEFVWSSEVVAVKARWACVTGCLESMLSSKPSISIPVEDFVAEWKRPLEVIRAALDLAGYTPAQIAGIRRLDAVLTRLPRYGELYRSGEI